MALDNFREKYDVVIGLYLDMLQQPGEFCWAVRGLPAAHQSQQLFVFVSLYYAAFHMHGQATCLCQAATILLDSFSKWKHTSRPIRAIISDSEQSSLWLQALRQGKLY